MSLRSLFLHMILELKYTGQASGTGDGCKVGKSNHNSQASAETKWNGLEVMLVHTFQCFQPW